jgi:hypothetical protein
MSDEEFDPWPVEWTTEDRHRLACLSPVTTEQHDDDRLQTEYPIRTLREDNRARLSILPMYPHAAEPTSATAHLLLSNVPSQIFDPSLPRNDQYFSAYSL